MGPDMKDLAKLIAPYLTAILSAIGVYTTSQTKIAMLCVGTSLLSGADGLVF